jgi:hypothetical protein
VEVHLFIEENLKIQWWKYQKKEFPKKWACQVLPKNPKGLRLSRLICFLVSIRAQPIMRRLLGGILEKLVAGVGFEPTAFGL